MLERSTVTKPLPKVTATTARTGLATPYARFGIHCALQSHKPYYRPLTARTRTHAIPILHLATS